MADGETTSPIPTSPHGRVDQEHARWSRIFGGEEYYYGDEPGPVARRAVRYHRPVLPAGGTALDAGCGEGQDLLFLAERGYLATGVEFTAGGAEKARRLAPEAEVVQADLREYEPEHRFDLVLAVNSIQFLGADASWVLDRVLDWVSPGGVIGLSLFAREAHEPEVEGTIWFTTLNELLARVEGWQCLEAAQLWQWNVATNEPQPFVTLIARKQPPARTLVRLGGAV